MIWLDASQSPRIARWIREELGRSSQALREIGLRDAEDESIFERARADDAILLTKDKDFVDLVGRFGHPPAVIWLRCGNTSETSMKRILSDHLDATLEFIAGGEAIVEIQ